MRGIVSKEGIHDEERQQETLMDGAIRPPSNWALHSVYLASLASTFLA